MYDMFKEFALRDKKDYKAYLPPGKDGDEDER